MEGYGGARADATILTGVREHAAGGTSRLYTDTEQLFASSMHRWLEQTWQPARDRYLRRQGREGWPAATVFPAEWLATLDFVGVHDWTDALATSVEAAFESALQDLAELSGTHVALFGVVTPAPRSRRAHARALLTIDPAGQTRRGIAAVLDPRVELHQQACSTIQGVVTEHIHRTFAARLRERGATPCENDPRVTFYDVSASLADWLAGRPTPLDHAGELYVAKHLDPYEGDRARPVILAACPGRASARDNRLHACVDDKKACAYGFAKRVVHPDQSNATLAALGGDRNVRDNPSPR